MTINDKRAKIEEHCDNTDYCPDCPLFEQTEPCYETKDEKVINHNYRLLVSKGCIAPKELEQHSKEVEVENNPIELKHLKGYIFDSLAYRYQLAREKQVRYEVEREGDDAKSAQERARRDTMRFIQILHEAIGEHD